MIGVLCFDIVDSESVEATVQEAEVGNGHGCERHAFDACFCLMRSGITLCTFVTFLSSSRYSAKIIGQVFCSIRTIVNQVLLEGYLSI